MTAARANDGAERVGAMILFFYSRPSASSRSRDVISWRVRRAAEFRAIATDETLGKTSLLLFLLLLLLRRCRFRARENRAREMHSHAELDRVAAHIAARKLYTAIQAKMRYIN